MPIDLASLTPEQLDAVRKVLGTGIIDEKNAQLLQQIQQAVGQQNAPTQGTGLISGIAGALKGRLYRGKEADLRSQFDSNLDKKLEGRVIAAGMPTDQSSLLGILSGDAPLTALGKEQTEQGRFDKDRAQKAAEANMRYGPQPALGGVAADVYDAITKRKAQDSTRYQPVKINDMTGEMGLFDTKTGRILPLRRSGMTPPPTTSATPDAASSSVSQTTGANDTGQPRMTVPTIELQGGQEQSRDPELEAAMLRHMPADIRKQLEEADTSVSALSRAQQAVEGRPGAFGAFQQLSDYLPGLNIGGMNPLAPLAAAVDAPARMTRSPEDEQARAAVFSQAYSEIHKLAGAQLSPGEAARLKTFLPNPNDSAEEIAAKLASARESVETDRTRLRGRYLPNLYSGNGGAVSGARLQRALKAIRDRRQVERDSMNKDLGGGTGPQ